MGGFGRRARADPRGISGLPVIVALAFLSGAPDARAATATLGPNAEGSITGQWNYLGGSTNFANLTSDDGDTSYAAATAKGLQHLVGLADPDPGLTTGTINAITLWAKVRVEGAITDRLLLLVRPTLTQPPAESAQKSAFSTTYVVVFNTWATSPATGAAWTWSEVAALEAGVATHASFQSPEMRATQLYVTVDYQPGATPTATVSPTPTPTGTWSSPTPGPSPSPTQRPGLTPTPTPSPTATPTPLVGAYLDRPVYYTTGDTAVVSVWDASLDQNPGVKEFVQVKVTSGSDTFGFSLLLGEESASSARFTSTSGDGDLGFTTGTTEAPARRIRVVDGDTVRAEHVQGAHRFAEAQWQAQPPPVGVAGPAWLGALFIASCLGLWWARQAGRVARSARA